MRKLFDCLGKIGCVALTAAVVLIGLGDAGPAHAQQAEFCWKDSYGRGVGRIPKSCRSDEDHIGLLCYKKCPAGMKRFGFDCHSICPAGFRDDGLFCRNAEYGRGGGSGKKHCEHKHGHGNCERNGLLFYPKCRAGYHNFGCCICRPHVPDCKALGLRKGIDLSCAKIVKIGKPRTGQCASDEEKNAGLCYKKCRSGFKGVGPVCWGKPPEGWVNCGMGAAKSKGTCGSAIADQVMSVGELAMNVATLGSSAAVTEAADAGEDAGKIAELKKQYNEMKEAWDALKESEKYGKYIEGAEKTMDTADGAYTTYQAIETGQNATTPEDMTRMAATITSLMDPSGVSSVVSAYTYPKCSKYFPK